VCGPFCCPHGLWRVSRPGCAFPRLGLLRRDSGRLWRGVGGLIGFGRLLGRLGLGGRYRGLPFRGFGFGCRLRLRGCAGGGRGLLFDRGRRHLGESLCAVDTAIRTFITPFGTTSKAILLVLVAKVSNNSVQTDMLLAKYLRPELPWRDR